MQTLNGPPRNVYTAAQVLAVLRDSPSLVVDKGLEVIDRNLNATADVSEFLEDGTVGRVAYATLHGRANLSVSTELDWGRDLVRPFMVLSDGYGAVSARFNLGAYIMDIPERHVNVSPPTYEVEAYDIVGVLDTPVGESYSLPAGSSYLDGALSVCLDQGFTMPIVDYVNADLVLPAARVWAIDQNITWLTVVNDCLGAIGYQGLWSDWDGRLHLVPYTAPSLRASEFTYDTGAITAMMADDAALAAKFFDTPNKWVWVRSSETEDDTPPSEGNGIFTFVNATAGPTSVEARGRTIVRVEYVEAANQASLQARAEQAIASDTSVSTKVTVTTSPNPLHWHFDRITVDDARLGPPMEALSTQWTLPLSGANMAHEWTVLTQGVEVS